MPPADVRTIDDIQADFDEIARLTDSDDSGGDKHDQFLLSLVPERAVRVLDIGCGVGRLTWAIARDGREVVGVDLSAAMIDRARRAGRFEGVSFHQTDFLTFDFGGRPFDCILSAAALHHMAYDTALLRMVGLLRPGGRLILQDLRRNATLPETLRAYAALARVMLGRIAHRQRPFPTRRVREAWARHGANETYLSFQEAQALADQHLPGATVRNHPLWRYTIVWDKPRDDSSAAQSG